MELSSARARVISENEFLQLQIDQISAELDSMQVMVEDNENQIEELSFTNDVFETQYNVMLENLTTINNENIEVSKTMKTG